MQSGTVNGAHIGRERLAINHLFFADDSILFGEASEEGVGNIKQLIAEYTNCSGQQVNFDKSLIYFSSNVPNSLRVSLGSALGVRLFLNPEKYLGLPLWLAEIREQLFVSILIGLTA
ncbi:hypothetical protein V6N13_021441 [Hibiscus sabdariffa]